MRITAEQCDEAIDAIRRVRDNLGDVYAMDRHLRTLERPDGYRTSVRPQGGSSTTGPGALRLVRERGAAIVVIDGAAKAMAREGLDEDRASDVVPQLDLLAMHLGYRLQTEPWDEHPDEWVRFTLEPA